MALKLVTSPAYPVNSGTLPLCASKAVSAALYIASSGFISAKASAWLDLKNSLAASS